MNPDLFFRPAQSDDLQAVMTLWSDCGLVTPDDSPAEDFQFTLGNANADILMAFRPDGAALQLNAVGAVLVGHYGRQGWIRHFAVHPGHQRRGVGLRLAREAEAWLKQRRISRLSVLVKTATADVILFFGRLGYLVVPQAVMQKSLV
jgi:ribosomal protein S18 acetylase RimI-like enzyme